MYERWKSGRPQRSAPLGPLTLSFSGTSSLLTHSGDGLLISYIHNARQCIPLILLLPGFSLPRAVLKIRDFVLFIV